MKALQYLLFLLLFIIISGCGFTWFPNQNEESNLFSNVYSSKHRKKPSTAAVGKCYEKYIKSPYNWVEVICEQHIHADFAERLNTKLIHAGFLNPKNLINRQVIDFRTKAALTKYQRYYCLPQGTLNIQSLLHLGV